MASDQWIKLAPMVVKEIDAQRAEIVTDKGKVATREEFIGFIVGARAEMLKRLSQSTDAKTLKELNEEIDEAQ